MSRHFDLSFRSSALLWMLLFGGLVGCRTTAKSTLSDLAYADTASLHRLPSVKPSEMFTPTLSLVAPRSADLDDIDRVALEDQRAATLVGTPPNAFLAGFLAADLLVASVVREGN